MLAAAQRAARLDPTWISRCCRGAIIWRRLSRCAPPPLCPACSKPVAGPLPTGPVVGLKTVRVCVQLVYKMLRSPTEFESTPVIGHCMQEYFLKLMGSYRDFVEVDEPDVGATGEGMDAIPPGTRQPVHDDGYLRCYPVSVHISGATLIPRGP